MKMEIGPDKLDLQKSAFPCDRDTIAFNYIMEAERKIEELRGGGTRETPPCENGARSQESGMTNGRKRNAKNTQSSEELYRHLLCTLSDRLVENDPTNSNFDHFMQSLSPYLSPVQMSPRNVFTIFEHLEMKRKLGPHNLGLLKKAFPKDRDCVAFERISETESQIASENTEPVKSTGYDASHDVIVMKDEVYRSLLCKLNDRLDKDDPYNTNYQHFMQTMKAHLPPCEVASGDLFKICRCLETRVKLGPDNLELLKKAFPRNRDNTAFQYIVDAEMKMSAFVKDLPSFKRKKPNQKTASRKHEIYQDLLCRLNDRLVKNDGNNTNHDHFILTVSTYLSKVATSSGDFLTICDQLEVQSLLGPENLGLLKEIFLRERDSTANQMILHAEEQIQHLSQ